MLIDRARAAASLPIVHLGLRVAGYQRVRALLRLDRPIAAAAMSGPDEGLAVIRARRSVASASHRLHVGNCLSRTTVLTWILVRQGIPAEIRFGATRMRDEFHAHAWADVRGVTLDYEGFSGERSFNELLPQPPRPR